MKVSVCGKGGSGKSTVVALLSRAARERGFKVLVVDSDESNSGLFMMLGLGEPPVPLMDLLGGRRGLKERMGREILREDRLTIEDVPHLTQSEGRVLPWWPSGRSTRPWRAVPVPWGP